MFTLINSLCKLHRIIDLIFDQDDEVSEEAIKAAEEELKKQQEGGDTLTSPAKKLKTSDVSYIFNFMCWESNFLL